MTRLVEYLRPLYVDHVAVSTAHFEETVRDYLAFPGARMSRGPGYNASQHVRFAFVQLDGGLRIEVLGLPDDGGGPIAAHVARGGGAYHICYAVADIDIALAAAEAGGARIVSPPKPDPAHDQRPVAFLVDAAHGLVELVAAYPAGLTAPTPRRAGSHDSSNAERHAAQPAPASVARGDEDEAQAQMLAVFRSVLKTLGDDEIRAGRLGITRGWDSLAHLQLVMETERRLKLQIATRDIEKLKTFSDFVAVAAGR